jgi:hypothetical protein
MSAAKSAEMSTKKKIIPLNPSKFVKENVRFSNVKNNTELGLKWVDISYMSDGSASDEKLLVIARNCVIKTFGKAEMKAKGVDAPPAPAPTKDGKPRKDKFSIFMSLKDEKFIDMIDTFETYLENIGSENSKMWLDEEYTVGECHEMLKPCISKKDKYGCAIGGTLSRDFTCRSKTDEVPDVSNLEVALAKNNVVDVCFHIHKVKLGAGQYRLGMEISQINVVGISQGGGDNYDLKPEEYASGKITLTPLTQHEKGGKFCKIQYDGHPLSVQLENIKARIFKFDKDDTVSYSMSIRLSDPTFRKMIESLDEEVFNLFVVNSKEYLGAKKTAKIARPMIKPIYSYNKTDQDKIKKGEKPTYDPSIWLKIYFSAEKGFDGKIINSETGKPIQNTEELLNKDLDISSINFYSRHIWFGPKCISTNFTLGKCVVSYETPEYDMDAIGGDAAASDTAVSNEEAANSDAE